MKITKDDMEGMNGIILQGDSSDEHILLVNNNYGQDITGSLGIFSRNSMLFYVYFKSIG